jgi:3-dehydroquinate synthase
MKTVTVHASRTYDIVIARGILDGAGARIAEALGQSRIMIVTDDTVNALYAARLEKSLTDAGLTYEKFVFPHGEASKNIGTLSALLETLAEKAFSRSDVLVALGGGVVGDLTGFAAATFLRGIRYVGIPTTLLADVDSSVGGKTAVDLRAGKNLAGAFWQPSLVLCDPDTLSTLPGKIFNDGMAEVIKYGMINNPCLLTRLQGEYDINEIIEISVTAKRDIVAVDERDTGIRQLLNFGHTPAHGIEILSEFTVSHGSAVAIGMVIMTKAAIQKGLCEEDALHTLLTLLEKFSLPAKTVFSAKEISDIALSDKKRAGDEITLVLPEKSVK